MANDDFAEDDDSDALERYSPRVNYIFDWQPYDTHTFNEFKHERDEVLAFEVRKYYPELLLWPDRALATAWRSYSKNVGHVEEEFACLRSPNLLAYLFARQEKWPVSEGDWLTAIDAAAELLWPTATDTEPPLKGS